MASAGFEPRGSRMGFLGKHHCFSLLNVTRRSRYWRPRRVKVETSVSTVISRKPRAARS